MLADLAINAAFAARGEAASYTPPGGGSSVPCTVILDSSDRELRGMLGRAVMKGVNIRVRKSEIASPAKGGTFVLTATSESLEIQSDPEALDAMRAVWTCIVA